MISLLFSLTFAACMWDGQEVEQCKCCCSITGAVVPYCAVKLLTLSSLWPIFPSFRSIQLKIMSSVIPQAMLHLKMLLQFM